MEPDRPFREWPLEQLAEQAALHAGDRTVLAGLLAEAALRPGRAAKALRVRLEGLLAGHPTPDAPAAELRALLAAAAAEIEELRARLRRAEAAGPAARPPARAVDDAGPHRRVYLTPDAPAWLVAEVRRAFRRRYHPDAQVDPARRRRAEEVFKRAEAVFDDIENRRWRQFS